MHHQHFFSFRLDMDVDGEANRVVEMNTLPVPAGPQNPYGGAFTMQESVLGKESEAQRDIPCILMSSMPEANVRERIHDYAAFVRKPFRLAAMVDLVAAVLDAPSAPEAPRALPPRT